MYGMVTLFAIFLTLSATFAAAAGIGYTIAEGVEMERMPELVAGFHSFVGLAAVLVGFANHFGGDANGVFLKLLEEYIGVGIGALTFTGSVVAAGKLHGSIPGRPIASEHRWTLNAMGLLLTAVLGAIYTHPGSATLHTLALVLNSLTWSGLGVNMVLPVGGADMPVLSSVTIIVLLNN